MLKFILCYSDLSALKINLFSGFLSFKKHSIYLKFFFKEISFHSAKIELDRNSASKDWWLNRLICFFFI